MKISFSPPFIDDDVRREVLEALDSGWITSGPKVLALENLVAREMGLTHVACCNSATSGLMLLLHWYGVTKGDEVILPAYTYAATALVVMHLGATPVMVDSGPDFNMDIEQVRKKITAKTKVIIPVDIAGWPCDYQEIMDEVNKEEWRSIFCAQGEHQSALKRILVLADAAHSIGATYKSQPACKWADFTVFSFHAVKNVTTAEGGAMCMNLPAAQFDNAQVYKTLKLWSLNGQTKDALAKTNGAGWKYDIVYQGFKINMPDICAAIGLAQLRKYDAVILPERKRVFNKYLQLFSSFAWAELPVIQTADKKSSCHLFALRIHGITEQQRDRIIERVESAGVSVNVHFQPLPLLTLFKENFSIVDYPVAYDSYSREISLPVYPELDEVKIDHIVRCVADSYKQVIYG